jgi:predicted CXXCH cytochrome family protein
MWRRGNEMKKTMLILTILFGATISATAKESSCINCHRSSDWVSDTTIVIAFLAGDIHASRGISCEDCHGGDPNIGFAEGDPDVAMDPAKGYKPPPDKAGIPEFCARCHSDIEFMKKFNPRLPTDQLSLFKTSVHGKLLYGQGDTMVAVCSDCHGAHGILRAADTRSKVYYRNVPNTCKNCHSNAEYMAGYKTEKGQPIPTDQFDDYIRSVHGALALEKGDQSAPVCNDCHGSHGATPPNIASVSASCGECHASNRDFFNGSPHKEPWIELGYAECEQCHGNHFILAATDSLIGIENNALCVQCHDPGTGGYAAAATMRSGIDSLKLAIEQAEAVVHEAETKGVEGGQARFDLGAAKDNMTRVRAVIHTFDPQQVTEVTSSGIATAKSVQETAQAALGDFKIRQIGLGMSVILILIVAAALWLKIRQVDKRTDFTRTTDS